MRLRRAALCAGVLSALLLCAAARAQVPLPPAAQALAEAPPSESPTLVHRHFLESNERRHDVFFPLISGRGGAYLGVGADQNYTLAAVAGAQLLWLLDIDELVVHWHRIYSALLPLAQTPTELQLLLSRAPAERVAAALRSRHGEDEAALLLPTFLRDRHRLSDYVRREIAKGEQGHSWLNDPDLFWRVRALHQARRVVARVGDLRGTQTVLAVAAAARALRLPLRTVYLSNAEQWFRYNPQFVRNIGALASEAGDGRALVLRTLARPELHAPLGDRWHFSVMPLSDFAGRLQRGELRMVQGLIEEMARSELSRGLSYLGPVPLTALTHLMDPPF